MRGTTFPTRRRRPGRLWLAALLPLLTTACQTSPGRLSGCTPDTAGAGKSRVLARQVLCDTAEEFATHPLRAGRTVLADQAGWFASVSRGVFGKRIAMRLHGAPPPLCGGSNGLDPELLESNLQPAEVRLYREGGDALGVLHQMIDSAQCRIDVLMYIWENDPVGWELARHLAAWAGPGRRVRVLIDGGANLIFGPTPGNEEPTGEFASRRQKRQQKQQEPKTAGQLNAVVCWLAAQPGVELIRIRNPLAHFDHRKLVLIDGRDAWAGGRNFTYPGFFRRHDVSLTLRGPLVAQFQAEYDSYWLDQGGRPEGPVAAPAPPLVANAAGRLVFDSPTEHGLRRAVYHAIDHARSSVWLENPYMTDNGILTRLARARRRGVDVRVVFTIRSDTDSINHTNRVSANRLLAAGVRVYLYPGRVHTKAALVDGCWAYLGSGNFDLLSLRRNHELGIVLGPGPVVDELAQVLFLPDFNPTWELCEPLKLTPKDYAYEVFAAFFL